jgi:esterase/lipase superfamily enzyme
VPFIHDNCQSPGIAITTTGASFGRLPRREQPAEAPAAVSPLPGAARAVYDLRRFMDGDYDENFYFNNPVDLRREPLGPLVPRSSSRRTTSGS